MILMENTVQRGTIEKVVAKIKEYMDKSIFDFD